MATYYISDPHFGHEKIISLCKRPFRSASEMDNTILTNINMKITADDELWILGDFSCGGKATDLDYIQRIFYSIQGKKHLIIGNHDVDEVLNLPWESVQDQKLISDDGVNFFLCHYPMMTWPEARKGAFHLFGHIHNNWIGCQNSMNMSVEHWNYEPASAQDILRRAKKLPKHKHWHDVEPESH